jgi:hypothetical protein
MYRVTFKAKGHGRWIRQSLIVEASSREDAIRKADRWPELILKVERI